MQDGISKRGVKANHMICPVCGYKFLPEDAMNHDICVCCGTEFGYDDVTVSYGMLRVQWLNGGGEWFDKSIGPPSDWNPWEQVLAAFGEHRFVAGKPIASEFLLDPSWTIVRAEETCVVNQ
jgi:hypothetical protein